MYIFVYIVVLEIYHHICIWFIGRLPKDRNEELHKLAEELHKQVEELMDEGHELHDKDLKYLALTINDTMQISHFQVLLSSHYYFTY